jgi:hypothetical protein
MKTFVQTLVILCCGLTAHAAQQIVVPGGLESTEGNSASGDLFTIGSSTFLQVYASSEFASLGAPTGIITGVSFRLDTASGQRFGGVWPSVAICLSTSSRSPDGLSPVFNDNVGADSICVFGGRLGFVANPSPNVEPQPFLIHIPFTTPYLYVPSRGNLLMGIVTFGGTTNLMLDAQLATGDAVGRVFADSFSATSGTVDTLGLITRFDVIPVPEPTVFVLVLVAGSMLFFSWRLRPTRGL